MQKIVNFTKEYIGVISIVLALCILLSSTLSSFIVTTGKTKVAEMYVGQLKYSMTIEGESTNTLTVPAGETIVDIDIANLNAINTYYKLLYEKNSNIEISYYESTKDTDEVVTNYTGGGDLVNASASTTLKIKIKNNSNDNQTLIFKVSGGYSTNTLADVEVPSGYTEIKDKATTNSNTYFCKTSDTLTEGLSYNNKVYNYTYKQMTIETGSTEVNKYGWSVILTHYYDSIDENVCTYINNRPIIDASYMFYQSTVTDLDISNFDTSNVTDMSNMFGYTAIKNIDLSSFDTSNVTNMENMFIYNLSLNSVDLSSFNTENVKNMSGMFYMCTSLSKIYASSKFSTINVRESDRMFYETSELEGGNGTKYSEANVEDSYYARIDTASSPGYFTLKQ